MRQYTATFPYLNTYEEPNEDDLPEVEEYDIVFLGNAYSQARWDIWKFLDGLRGQYKIGLFGKVYGGFEPIPADGVNHYNYAEGRAIYRKSKLAISTNEFGATGYTSNRYFEITASGGAMCLHERTPKFGNYTRTRAGTHYVQWNDMAHLEQLIHEWMKPKNDKRRKRIALNAMKNTSEKHCGDARVKYVLTEVVPKLAKAKGNGK
jgi:hypothetical protein